MPGRKSSFTSNSSRTAAKVAVVVLIAIAIAGFVLAGLKAGKSAPEQVAAADPTQERAVAPTVAAAPAASRFGLAQRRARLVRETLERGGVRLARMTIKISQVPQGAVAATDASRVAMVLQ